MTEQQRRSIFVFASNKAGRHGKGSALEARLHWGAKPGYGIGFTGNAYAIPTKDHRLRPMPLTEIAYYVDRFTADATYHTEMDFMVVAIGTGERGLAHDQMAPLFKAASVLPHVRLPTEWRDLLDSMYGVVKG